MRYTCISTIGSTRLKIKWSGNFFGKSGKSRNPVIVLGQVHLIWRRWNKHVTKVFHINDERLPNSSVLDELTTIAVTYTIDTISIIAAVVWAKRRGDFLDLTQNFSVEVKRHFFKRAVHGVRVIQEARRRVACGVRHDIGDVIQTQTLQI